jgi:hypothetical protein
VSKKRSSAWARDTAETVVDTAGLADASSHVVYALTDSLTGEVRYVGHTSIGLVERLTRHLDFARTGKAWRVSQWLRDAHYEIGVTVLESDPVDLYACEKAWIARLIADGLDLTNCALVDFTPSPEHREAITAFNRRRFADPAERARVGDRMRGRQQTPEVKEKLRALNLGRRPADVIRERMSAENLGKPKSPEHREKIALAAKRRGAQVRGLPAKKLAPEAVREIRKLYAAGDCVQRELAERFGVSGPTISGVVNRRRYADVA